MARVIRSEQAQADLEGILDYLESQRSQAAERFAVKFEQTCELHATHAQNWSERRGIRAEPSAFHRLELRRLLSARG
jgi:plasmid stabilization system protein ParE